MLLAEHFVQPPNWAWFILGYFFLAGLMGGSYAIATALRLWGQPADEHAARLGFYASFVAVIICPILLTLDLGQPSRFWHMLVDTTPGSGGLNFESWSPMSVGVWALTLFGIVATISFLETLLRDGRLGRGIAERVIPVMDGPTGRVINVVGALLGLFMASYTGVLLMVSNQPVWSDTWMLGGLFLASGLGGSVALLTLLARWRTAARYTEGWLEYAGSLLALLELALIVIFLVTVAFAGTAGQTLGSAWWLLWIVVVISLVPALAGLAGRRVPALAGVAGGGSTASGAGAIAATAAWMPVLVLVGVLALRAVVIFSAQA